MGSLRRACRAAALAFGCTVLALPAAQAVQVEAVELSAWRVFNLAAFQFGTNPFVDTFTPAQTGFASTDLLATGSDVAALWSANPVVTARIAYDGAGLTPIGTNGVLSGFIGGTSLSITLPQGTAGTPLVFDNGAGQFPAFALVDNGRLGSEGLGLFLPGTADSVQFAMVTSDYTNANLLRTGATGVTSTIDLLADARFVETYNGSVPLPSLPNLTVRLQQPSEFRLNDPSLQFLDGTGMALSGLAPPASLDLSAFGSAFLLLPFDGTARLTLDAADYASAADFAAAQSWVAASGLSTQVVARQIAVWSLSPVPEPAPIVLFGAGLLAFALAGRRFSAP